MLSISSTIFMLQDRSPDVGFRPVASTRSQILLTFLRRAASHDNPAPRRNRLAGSGTGFATMLAFDGGPAEPAPTPIEPKNIGGPPLATGSQSSTMNIHVSPGSKMRLAVRLSESSGAFTPIMSMAKARPPRIMPSTLLKAYGSPDATVSPTKNRSTTEVPVSFVIETIQSTDARGNGPHPVSVAGAANEAIASPSGNEPMGGGFPSSSVNVMACASQEASSAYGAMMGLAALGVATTNSAAAKRNTRVMTELLSSVIGMEGPR